MQINQVSNDFTLPTFLDLGSQPMSISRSVSDTHSPPRVLRRSVRKAYFPFRRTCALQVPCLLQTIVAIRAVLSIPANSVHIEIKQGAKSCNLVQFSARCSCRDLSER